MFSTATSLLSFFHMRFLFFRVLYFSLMHTANVNGTHISIHTCLCSFHLAKKWIRSEQCGPTKIHSLTLTLTHSIVSVGSKGKIEMHFRLQNFRMIRFHYVYCIIFQLQHDWTKLLSFHRFEYIFSYFSFFLFLDYPHFECFELNENDAIVVTSVRREIVHSIVILLYVDVHIFRCIPNGHKLFNSISTIRVFFSHPLVGAIKMYNKTQHKMIQ